LGEGKIITHREQCLVNEAVFGSQRLQDILIYRKVSIAVVATYLGLDEAFVEAVLLDQMDEYLEALAPARETQKSERYEEYLSVLSREIIVRYAATASEAFAADPGLETAPKRPNNAASLGQLDDSHAIVRVHEIFEYLESPHAEGEIEALLVTVKRKTCNYYHAIAQHLVQGPLLSVIIGAAEEYVRGGSLTAIRVRELVIAAQ
jgi:hypothetical protein